MATPLLGVAVDAWDDEYTAFATPHAGLAPLPEDETLQSNDPPMYKWPSRSSLHAQEGAPELSFVIRTHSRIGGAQEEVVTDVAEVLQDAVQQAIGDQVQQVIGDHLHFNVKANVYTLMAVTGVILYCACGRGAAAVTPWSCTQGGVCGRSGTPSSAALWQTTSSVLCLDCSLSCCAACCICHCCRDCRGGKQSQTSLLHILCSLLLQTARVSRLQVNLGTHTQPR